MHVSYLFVGNKTIPIGTNAFTVIFSSIDGYYTLFYGDLRIMASTDTEVLTEFVEWVIRLWSLNHKVIRLSDFKPTSFFLP